MKIEIGFHVFMGVVSFVVAFLGTFLVVGAAHFGLEAGFGLSLKVAFWAALSVIVLSMVMAYPSQSLADSAGFWVVGGFVGGAVSLIVLLVGFAFSLFDLPASTVFLILVLVGNGVGFLSGLANFVFSPRGYSATA